MAEGKSTEETAHYLLTAAIKTINQWHKGFGIVMA